jgi:tetrapyrrole methylase family protein/MazG family protein
MAEEFGDLLLQVVLHAQIASEAGDFTISDVLQMVNEKIVRRHPHVFGEVDLKDTHSVLQNWEKLKAIERESKGEAEKSLLDGVAMALPALVQAEQYQSRAARVGFVWRDVQDVLNKINEEIEEISLAREEEKEAEIGDLLFALVNLARWYHIDAESALRNANRKFRDRFKFLEDTARKEKRILEDYSLEEKLVLWREAKVNQEDDN